MTSQYWYRLRDAIRTHRQVLKRSFATVFIILVSVLLVIAIKNVEWYKVYLAVEAMPSSALYWAAGFTVASYALYSCYDLLGRWYTRHQLTWWRSVLSGFIAYAFTMSLGTPVGNVGMRMRLYSKQGLKQNQIVRIIAVSLTTNWIGYLFLISGILLTGQLSFPVSSDLGNGALRIIGGFCLMAALTYLLGSAFSNRSSWRIRGHTIDLPGFHFALLQSALSALNWALIAGVLHALFQGQVPYINVLAMLLIGAVAGAVSHIPGGVGVVEYVFISQLMPVIPRSETLAVLLVYRLFYYITPLLIAGLVYLFAEASIKTTAPPAS